MNPAVILSLISELYNNVAALTEHNGQLETALAEQENTNAELTANVETLAAEKRQLEVPVVDTLDEAMITFMDPKGVLVCGLTPDGKFVHGPAFTLEAVRSIADEFETARTNKSGAPNE